jgi:predicted Fe-Mo cluster-binding NifX family protein
MKVCFPVASNKGLQSKIYGHFSSAPLFLLVDSESKEIEEVENCDPKDPFQGCNPLAALKDKGMEAIVVEGVADAVLQVMTNIHHYPFYGTLTGDNNIEQALEHLKNNELQKIEPFYSQNEGRCGEDDEEDSCSHHDHDHEEEEEQASVCVNHGGAGCGSHGEGSCTQH